MAYKLYQKLFPVRLPCLFLECILVDATNGEIKLTANDMELGIETTIEGQIVEKGIIALDAKCSWKSYENFLTVTLPLKQT